MGLTAIDGERGDLDTIIKALNDIVPEALAKKQ